MKNLLGFAYSLVCYLVSVSALVYWILATSDLIPLISLEKEITLKASSALVVNVLLIIMFGLQHSVMARKSFKTWITKYISPSIERSTFVLVTGVVLPAMVYLWQPMSGTLWSFSQGTTGFYVLY